MKTYLLPFVCLFAFGLSPTRGSAQIILVGCTARLTGIPQTTFSSIVDLSPNNGTSSNVRQTGLQVLAGIAFQPSTGLLFGLTTDPSVNPVNSLVTIDMATGAHTTIGSTGLRIVEGDLAVNPINGFLYGVQDVGTGASQRNLFQINPATGAGTVIGNLGVIADDFSALAFDNLGNLYAINTGDGGSANSILMRINPSNGNILDTVGMNFNLGAAAGMAFDANGTAYVADGGSGATNQLFTLNVSSGFLNPIGNLDVIGGIAGLTVVPVPEPASFVLMLIGVACGWLRTKASTISPR